MERSSVECSASHRWRNIFKLKQYFSFNPLTDNTADQLNIFLHAKALQLSPPNPRPEEDFFLPTTQTHERWNLFN